jgi:hypothetical protein
MTHKYYYVSAGKVCDEHTCIYSVMIGESLQGRRDHDFLQSYAIQHGHYFTPVSNESDIFIDNLVDSLAEFDIKRRHLSGRDLVKLLRQGVSSALDKRQLHTADYQLKMLDTSYRIISNLNRRSALKSK